MKNKMRINYIYIITLLVFMSCTTDEEKRLLQVMDESSKTAEINAVKSFFREKRVQDKLYAELDSFLVAKELCHLVKYKPEYFILSHNKDTCIIVFSEDIPFPIDMWYRKKPAPLLNLKRMSCFFSDGQWDILKDSDYEEGDSISDPIFIIGHKGSSGKERYVKRKRHIAKTILDSDIKEMINKKYWFDEYDNYIYMDKLK